MRLRNVFVATLTYLSGVFLAAIAVANPIPLPGPCCFGSGECHMLGIDECAIEGGMWLGEDLPCDPSPCWGACCTEFGSCVFTDYVTCVVPMGRFLGPWTDCAGAPCSIGACCLSDGTCVMLLPSDCASQGGEFTYEGYPCSLHPCDAMAVEPSEPARLSLRAAPNPFVFDTVLRLALAAPGRPEAATCRVLDATGRVIRVLSPEIAAGESATFRWDGRDDAGRAVAAGAYFVRVHAGEVDESLVLLRVR